MRGRRMLVLVVVLLLAGYVGMLIHLRHVGSAIAADPKLRSYAALPPKSADRLDWPEGIHCPNRWWRPISHGRPAEFGGIIENKGTTGWQKVRAVGRGYDREGRLVVRVIALCKPPTVRPGQTATYRQSFLPEREILWLRTNIVGEPLVALHKNG